MTTNSTARPYNLGKATDDGDKFKSYTRTYSNLGRDKTVTEEKEKDKEKSKGYTRSYTTLGRSKANDEKEKELSPSKRLSARYNSSKELTAETKSRLTSNYGAAKKEEKGPPITFNTRYKTTPTRPQSRDPSPTINNESISTPLTAVQRITAARNLSRDPSPSSKVSAYSRLSSTRSREPSPASNSFTGDTSRIYLNNHSTSLERTYSSTLSNRERSRDPSPITRSIVSNYPRSRDPSPVDNKYRPISSYQLSSERGTSRDPSPALSLKKFGSTSSGFSSTNNYGKKTLDVAQTKTLDISISYMTANESKARASRASFINRHSPQKDKLELPSMIPLRTESPKVQVSTDSNHKQPDTETDSEESSSSSEETDDSSEETAKAPETKIMIQVTTITRSTSPNPVSVTQMRTRRSELAKTIEKVRQRPLQGPPMFDKSTQSDRMDDSTRNSRYGITSRAAYSPYSQSSINYSPRPTSSLSTSRLSRERSESVSVAEGGRSDSSDKVSEKSDKCNFALSKSEETSSAKSESSRSGLTNSSPSSKANAENPRLKVSSSKSKTPESTKLLPPQSPTKSESPKSSSSKVSNKDFRKSALNMGPTDRVRRSKSSSSDNSSPTVEKTRLQFQQLLNGDAKNNKKSLERSSSAESESSTESVDVDSQVEQKTKNPTKEEIICHKVEEAKTFLLKTLGNSAAYNSLKSSSQSSEANGGNCANSESCSTSYPTQTPSTNLDFSKLQKSETGEKAWWMDKSSDSQKNSNEKMSNIEETSQIITDFSDMTLKTSNKVDAQRSKWPWLEEKLSLNDKLQKIERVKSGEKAWWCKSPENKTTSDNNALAQNSENTRNMWEQETQADVSEIQQDDVSQIGDRASPDGLESKATISSFNKSMGSVYQKEALQDFNARPKMFISRHTNIDDLLGKSL